MVAPGDQEFFRVTRAPCKINEAHTPGTDQPLTLMHSESEHSLSWNLRQIGGDCLYKIAHSWLDPVVNPVQTALGCPLRTVALAYPINGAER